MSGLSIFNFNSNSVRVVFDANGEPLFVGKDVAAVLGYRNHNDAMNDHCRGVTIRYPILDSLGRTQEARVLTESGPEEVWEATPCEGCTITTCATVRPSALVLRGQDVYTPKPKG